MNKDIGWREYLITQGMDPGDAPYTPIDKRWEPFPVIKAIRQWEKLTKKKYDNERPEVAVPFSGRSGIIR